MLILFYFTGRLGYIESAKWILIISSFAFYFLGEHQYFLLFSMLVIIDYIYAKYILTSSFPYRKIGLIVIILFNLSFLFYYKYLNFVLGNWFSLIGTQQEHVLSTTNLPLGISFFTFQLIAFLIDTYRNKLGVVNIKSYLFFITFFPQLIVGPIVHYQDVNRQIESKTVIKLNYRNLYLGIVYFVFGLSKKILLADPLTMIAQSHYNNFYGISGFEMLFAMISYTISYYFDLSGYADMAKGLGLLFNVELPNNFDSPYKATNFADYWRRWHMTLSRFLSDYIFRSVYDKNKGIRNFYYAIMVTFLVSGIWHGAGWNFIVWGLLNGVLVCISHLKFPFKIPHWSAVLLTFIGVIMTRNLFVSQNLIESIQTFHQLFSTKYPWWTMTSTDYFDLFTLIFAMYLCWFSMNSHQLTDKYSNSKRLLLLIMGLILILIFKLGEEHPFLYYQF